MLIEDFLSKTWPTDYSLKKATTQLWQDDDRVTDILREDARYTIDSTVATIVAAPKERPKLVVAPFDGVAYVIHRSIIVQSYEFGWMVISRVGDKDISYYKPNQLPIVISRVKELLKLAGIKLKPHRKYVMEKLEELTDKPSCAVEDLL